MKNLKSILATLALSIAIPSVTLGQTESPKQKITCESEGFMYNSEKNETTIHNLEEVFLQNANRYQKNEVAIAKKAKDSFKRYEKFMNQCGFEYGPRGWARKGNLKNVKNCQEFLEMHKPSRIQYIENFFNKEEVKPIAQEFYNKLADESNRKLNRVGIQFSNK